MGGRRNCTVRHQVLIIGELRSQVSCDPFRFAQLEILTRSRVTRWHVRAHSCLVMWVARSQSLRHDASHWAPRDRISSSSDFGTLATAAFADGTVEEVVLSVGAATEVVLSGCAADWA